MRIWIWICREEVCVEIETEKKCIEIETEKKCIERRRKRNWEYGDGI
jgi:hypothetical protein